MSENIYIQQKIDKTYNNGTTVTSIKNRTVVGVSTDSNDFYKALNECDDNKKDYSVWKTSEKTKGGNEFTGKKVNTTSGQTSKRKSS